MSGLAMTLPLPASNTMCPNYLADDILILSSSVFSMLSLKLHPSGCDTLMQMREFVGWGTARMELTLSFGSGGLINGPATNFFDIQDAMVSVTAIPSSRDFFEFFYNAGPYRALLERGAADLQVFQTSHRPV